MIVGRRGVPAALYDSTFSLQKDVLYYKIREYAAACRANKMEETAMEASKVYYTDFRCPVGTSLLDKLRRVCIAAGIKDIDMDGKFVAIKMHFGELGNLAFLRPNYAKVVADLCKEQGGLPFLTDCNTLYPGSRKNALEHLTCAQLNGFWPMTTGCQVIIADGLRGTDEAEVPVPNGEYCKTAKIGRAIMDADIFISLTHFKGHESTGFGGTLKNIGMGCGSRAGKMIQHAAGHPEVQQSLCRGCHAARRSAAPMPLPTMQTTRPSLIRPSARAAAAASVPATLTPSILSATAPMRCWTANGRVRGCRMRRPSLLPCFSGAGHQPQLRLPLRERCSHPAGYRHLCVL